MSTPKKILGYAMTQPKDFIASVVFILTLVSIFLAGFLLAPGLEN